MKQTIETKLGVIIILIFAITVVAFVWKWEKNQPEAEQSQVTYGVKKSTAKQAPIANQENNTQNDNQADQQSQGNAVTGTKKYINKTYGFEFEYPANLVITQSAADSDFVLSYDPHGHWGIDITVSANTTNLSLTQVLNQVVSRYAPEKVIITNINIGGKPAKRFSVQNYHDYGNAGVIMIYGNNIITIYGDDSNLSLKKIFETVIDSFKFYNQKDISFCGKIYKTDQMIINGTDVAKSIALISKKENWICQNLESGKYQESSIGLAQKTEGNNSYLISLFHKGNKNEESDPFNQSPNIFRFNFDKNQVLYQSQFGGSFKVLGIIE